MKISIVTVSFNEEKNIARTIESVLKQTTCDFEYIICDGKSTDKTVKIAESYEEAFLNKGIDYIINSEKDNGIYYGMNKGIEMATGEYIYFLNSGDWFYSNDVIEKVVAYAIEKNSPDVVYGHVANVERNTVSILRGNDKALYRYMSVCHQGVFASTALMQEHKFNIDYKIMADYDFLLGLKLAGKIFSQIDLVIAYFSVGGVSSVDAKGFIRDLLKIHEMRKSSLGALTKLRLRLGTYKTTVAIAIKAKMPLKLWYWWSIKVKKKTLLEK